MTNIIYAESVPKAIPSMYPLSRLSGCMLNCDMQESGSKIIDHSGMGNHGAYSGSVIQTGYAGFVRYFDGTDDEATFGNVAALKPQSLSILMWVNPNATQKSLANIISCHSLTSGYALQRKNLGGANEYNFLYLTTAEALQIDTTNTLSLTASVWQQVVITLSAATASTVRYYLNGVAIASQPTGYAGAVGYDTTALRIGDWVSGGRDWGGVVGLTQIYNLILRAAEVKELYRRDAWRCGLAA